MNIHSQTPPYTQCGSFYSGHDIHWIQALRSKEDPVTGEGSASVDSEGWITIHLDNGLTERRWTHDHIRLAGVLGTYGSRVVLRTMSVLGVPYEGGSRLFSVAKTLSSCPSADEELDEGSLMELLTKRGGFTISGQELMRRGLLPAD